MLPKFVNAAVEKPRNQKNEVNGEAAPRYTPSALRRRASASQPPAPPLLQSPQTPWPARRGRGWGGSGVEKKRRRAKRGKSCSVRNGDADDAAAEQASLLLSSQARTGAPIGSMITCGLPVSPAADSSGVIGISKRWGIPNCLHTWCAEWETLKEGERGCGDSWCGCSLLSSASLRGRSRRTGTPRRPTPDRTEGTSSRQPQNKPCSQPERGGISLIDGPDMTAFANANSTLQAFKGMLGW